jgi:glucose/mannose-6-phosphate isomerase
MTFEIDKSKMREKILDFPKQFKIGIESAKKAKKVEFKKLPQQILICGMGGSALPGELLLFFDKKLSFLKAPIFLHRDYLLPKNLPKDTLVVTISYSGNTEETLDAFFEAKKRKFQIFSIASGGKLEEVSRKFKVPFAKIPGGIQPRLALGYQFSALSFLLENHGLFRKKITNEILKLEKTLSPKLFEKKGKILAKKLLKKIPLIYSSSQNEVLAKIWKIKFNENSKVPSFFNVFPELNHNEMTGIGECKMKILWKNFFLLLISDKEDHPRIQKRMKILNKIFNKKGIKSFWIFLEGKDIFKEAFENILLGDFTSYFLAILNKVDPTPVTLVEKFKKLIK